MIPVFDVIPVIQNRTGVRIGVVTVAGVSTRHDSGDTDHGKLYADITPAGAGTFVLNLFSDFARSVGSLVAGGTSPGVGQYFGLDEKNGSGVTGRARLEGVGQTSPAILIVSFATDADVFASQPVAAAMPGYDEDYGFAAFFARGMKQILTSDLPAQIPALFQGKRLAAFTPLDAGAEYPDLSDIESPEALTAGLASLVKSLSAEEAEHTAEFADMADAARGRYAAALAALKAANTPAEATAQRQISGLQIGSFSRV